MAASIGLAALVFVAVFLRIGALVGWDPNRNGRTTAIDLWNVLQVSWAAPILWPVAWLPQAGKDAVGRFLAAMGWDPGLGALAGAGFVLWAGVAAAAGLTGRAVWRGRASARPRRGHSPAGHARPAARKAREEKG
ncbi:hypothetical protein M0638_20960 [Roseomonas sp. NAR14]|uniref:Uncharacterized protein n=1 Tax=Roseomonas acroporae TaxID=2937791 RepID=A0A9X1YBS8_9PROT|nr:hypothetical protein [Roseomonas acroporae]MCK8786847.1 hypothetical protein [Roseomonas acroporae]